MKQGAHIFVKIDEYKDILDTLNILKNKMDEARELLNKINELKNDEDTELDLWHTELEEIERKISFIDKAMFEPESI
ncbi:hypothetical protein HQ529_02730 [Candidatus Woesearchaeota archaeon]|nr:hypothetical protein [Candidatus Woesearchaeota archaeon]